MLKIIVTIANFAVKALDFIAFKTVDNASETVLSTSCSTGHTRTHITQLRSVPTQTLYPRAYQFSSLYLLY